jgi:NAD(P)-dependent dehydrogenase (short-subunit alcohol dehydrogenase family)
MTDAEQESRAVPEAGATPLADRAAVVTGASGIGRATAWALASAGARVGLAARRASRLEDLAEEIGCNGGEALALPTDVTDYAQAEAMVRRATEAFGGVGLDHHLLRREGDDGVDSSVDPLDLREVRFHHFDGR